MSYRLVNCWLLFVTLSIITSCSKNKEQFPIPKASELVVKINTSSIGEKLLFEKVKDFTWKDVFSFEGDDSTKEKSFWENLLNDPGKAGIDYLAPVYFFQYKSERFITVNLDDEDEFTQFIKGWKGEITSLNNGFSNYYLAPISINWNKKIVLFQFGDNKSVLKELLSLNKEHTIFNDPDFQKVIPLSEDIVCYLRPQKLLPDNTILSELNILNSGPSIIKVEFEKGKIKLIGENLIQSESETLFQKIQPPFYDTTNKAWLYVNLDPVILNKLDEQTTNILHNEFGLSKESLSTGLTGELYCNIRKINKGVKTFTTYQMDDDFNKVEITDTSVYYYPSFSLVLPMQNPQVGSDILNGLCKKRFLTPAGTDYTMDLFTPTVYVYFKDHYLVASDTKSGLKPNIKATTPNIFELQLNFTEELNKIIPLKYLVPVNMRQIKLTGTKAQGTIQFNGEILFKNENQNGLLQLLEQIKNKIQEDSIL